MRQCLYYYIEVPHEPKAWRKAWWEPHMNAKCYLEQILEVAPHETAAVWPFTTHLPTHQVRWKVYAAHCWRNKDELIGDVLLCTPTHGHGDAA